MIGSFTTVSLLVVLGSEVALGLDMKKMEYYQASGDEHCVVWGDGPIEGMKGSFDEAMRVFEGAKRQELVALHFDDRLHEVQRYVSPRLLNVKWNMLVDWCKENNSPAARGVAPVRRQRLASLAEVKPKQKQEPASDSDAVNMEAENAPQQSYSDIDLEADPTVHAAGQHQHQAVPSSEAPAQREALEAQPVPSGSSLSSKVDLIEKDMGKLGSKVVELKKILGSDDELEEVRQVVQKETKGEDSDDSDIARPDSGKERGDEEKHEVKQKATPKRNNKKHAAPVEEKENDADPKDPVDRSLLQDDPKMSLRGRVRALELHFPKLHQKTQVLEEEFQGTSKDLPQVQQQSKVSLKSKIETMLVKVEHMKHRMIELDPTPIITEIGGMEDNVSAHKLKFTAVANAVGVDSIEPRLTTSKNVKPRLVSLEKYVILAHQGTSSLEAELLGQASTYHLQASLTQKHKAKDHFGVTTSVKARMEGLKSDFTSLMSRLTALEATPTGAALEKLEAKMADLQTKCAALAVKVGVKGSDIETFSAQKESPFQGRILQLANYLSRLHAKLAPLEEELTGTGKMMRVTVATLPTVKAKIDALAKVVTDLDTRLSSLQSEV